MRKESSAGAYGLWLSDAFRSFNQKRFFKLSTFVNDVEITRGPSRRRAETRHPSNRRRNKIAIMEVGKVYGRPLTSDSLFRARTTNGRTKGRCVVHGSNQIKNSPAPCEVTNRISTEINLSAGRKNADRV
ncbi:hypothetical protein GWI33_005186 [Rhynchophorus ferrugineus]|uniref:Uncharacterized protein n=1 Tax=Rhynchophorus ferrugineus TaxID=354439 RepID=A0A834IHX3_RHYFE|nr:hypothetical protein GWI33_005186 [Rhynchophorus ferrugineus]